MKINDALDFMLELTRRLGFNFSEFAWNFEPHENKGETIGFIVYGKSKNKRFQMNISLVEINYSVCKEILLDGLMKRVCESMI